MDYLAVVYQAVLDRLKDTDPAGLDKDLVVRYCLDIVPVVMLPAVACSCYCFETMPPGHRFHQIPMESPAEPSSVLVQLGCFVS